MVPTKGTRLHSWPSVAEFRQWLSKNWGRVRFVAQSSPGLLAEPGARAFIRVCDDAWPMVHVGWPRTLARTFNLLRSFCVVWRGHSRVFRAHQPPIVSGSLFDRLCSGRAGTPTNEILSHQ